MSNYYNGTSAYKIDNFEYVNAPAGDVKESIERRKTIREGRKAEFMKRLRICSTMMAVFGITIGFLCTNAVIIEKSTEVNDKKQQLTEITEANNQIVLDIERNLDLKKIEDIAINELGMKHPDKYQIVYVNVEQNDYAEISGKEKKPEKAQTRMVAMENKAEKIIEYIN